MSLPLLAERAAGPLGRATKVPAWKRWWRFRDVHKAFGLKFWALISGGGALPVRWRSSGVRWDLCWCKATDDRNNCPDHAQSPFHVARGTLGKPLAGREVKLGPDGEVLVRAHPSPRAPGQTAHCFSARTNGWPPATWQWPNLGELLFLGRKSEVIVTSSGVNLHPEIWKRPSRRSWE